ncbi:MAG: zincin-like metallopeptidase domain-containing protein [Devosia sp.]|nr:zincin-like metallopeptidase domain-containing protein [Devosia sp.]
MSTAAPPRDLHAQITAEIIAVIEADPQRPVLPWRRAGLVLPANAATGNVYHGINVLALWAAAQKAAFSRPLWATYQQWATLGAQVRRGEKSSLVIFYKEYTSSDDKDGEGAIRRVARASHVFNSAQVEGFSDPASDETAAPIAPVERLRSVEQFVAATRADIRHGGDAAFYNRRSDFIQLPPPEEFVPTVTMAATEGYYATLLHELVHWSGATHRLDRQFGKRFGDEAYAAEELVAEIGAAFLCAELAVTPSTRADHAHYVGHWLQLLRRDSRAIFTAASRAAEASGYLTKLGEQRTPASQAASPASIAARLI